MTGGQAAPTEVSAITAELGRYVSEAARIALPPEVAAKAGMHVLDTFGAMLSGSRLDASAPSAGIVTAIVPARC